MKSVAAIASLCMSILTAFIIFCGPKTQSLPPAQQFVQAQPPQLSMPIVPDHPLVYLASNLNPIEQRQMEFACYLSVSLKIEVDGASGSGTIIYYDSKENYAYMQSCGHLWDGEKTAEQIKSRPINCRVVTWWKNGVKLSDPQSYPAEVLWYANVRGRDSSLLRFKPDWQPDYFPIAPADYVINPGMHLHSVGCDGGREVAHYDVEVIKESQVGSYALVKGFLIKVLDTNWTDLVTKNNSPRPGRSGGGLLSTDGFYVGICWGTSDRSGNGIGLFTPLSTVRLMNERNGYGWINEVGNSPARKIPIVEHNNPPREYPKDYIPLPNNR